MLDIDAVKHELVSRLLGEDKLTEENLAKVENIIDKHNQKSLKLIPEEYQELCKSRINKYIPTLEVAKEKYLESWNTF